MLTSQFKLSNLNEESAHYRENRVTGFASDYFEAVSRRMALELGRYFKSEFQNLRTLKSN